MKKQRGMQTFDMLFLCVKPGRCKCDVSDLSNHATHKSLSLKCVFGGAQFEASLRRELDDANRQQAQFVKDFSQEDYDYIVHGWQVCLTAFRRHPDGS